MGVFKTPRPTDLNKNGFEKLINLENERRKNLRAVMESADESKTAKELEKKLDDASKRAEKDEDNSSDSNKNRIDVEKLQKTALNERLNVAKLGLRDRLIKEGYEKLFENALFSIVYESYWLDDKLKESTITDMHNSFHALREGLKREGIKENTDTQLLKNIKEICMECAKKRADELVKECGDNCESSDDLDNISFSLRDEDGITLGDNLSDLGVDDISELVKMKVIQVVNDEQEAGTRKTDILNELKEASKTDSEEELEDGIDGEDDVSGIGEGGDLNEEVKEDDKDLDKKDKTEEEAATESDNSAVLRHHHRHLDNNQNNEENHLKYEDTEDKEESALEGVALEKYRVLNNKLDRMAGSSLFECLMMKSTMEVNKIVTENSVPTSWKNRMDMSFANALLEYTALEVLHTMKIIDMDNRTVGKYMNNIKRELA